MTDEKKCERLDRVCFVLDIIAAVCALILVVMGISNNELPWVWMLIGVFDIASAILFLKRTKNTKLEKDGKDHE